MATVAETKVIEHDLSTVYNQWTQFEEFPRFMDGVERVQQLDGRVSFRPADGGATEVTVEMEW